MTSDPNALDRIGVIGVGVMGTAIAGRLFDCGYDVVAFDRNPERLESLARRGARIGANTADVAAQVDIVIASLNSVASVEAVVFGRDGVTSVKSGKLLFVDMSSTDPVATKAMAERLRLEAGAGWVDAPLSGGAAAALRGELTLMLGGTDADVQRARGPLSRLGRNITHMGECGAGQTTKLINQVLCACMFLAVAEATRLAASAGMDASRIPPALAGGRADSRILQEFMPKMAAGDLTPTGRIDNMLKDLESAQSLAASMRTPMPVTALVTELHRMLVAAGMGACDSAAYMSLFDFGRSMEKRRDA